MFIFEKRGKPGTRGKTSRGREENQQIQPTCAVLTGTQPEKKTPQHLASSIHNRFRKRFQLSNLF